MEILLTTYENIFFTSRLIWTKVNKKKNNLSMYDLSPFQKIV